MAMNRPTAWMGLLLAVALAGCGTLPDAKPFAEASQTLATSVTSAGQAVVDSLGEAGALSASDEAAYKERADRFRAAWAEREAAARAVAAYAESVSDLISAGQQGGETVKKVGDSLSGLAGALGIPLATPAVGVLGDVARFLVDRIALVRASDSLETALAQAQPAVDRLAERIASESDQQLRTLLESSFKNRRSQIRGQYSSEPDQLKLLEARRLELIAPTLNDTAALPALLQQDQALASVRARLAERDRRLVENATAHKARLQLLNALSAATTTWAHAHRDLAAAVKEKRKVSVAELQTTVADLKALAKKVSEL
jgi:hypothetical protein